jgi:excinuclease UvrABC ATPase subunit
MSVETSDPASQRREEQIRVKGARVHNLKNIDVDIPKHKVVVFTGVSGSGKSSLVFDTVYTEAQRQLIETFSAFARRRLPKLSRPDIDEIENIATAIVIDQKKMGANMRSTVGTATEISTYMRLLFSRVGQPQIGPSHFFGFNHPEGMCPVCRGLGRRIAIDVDRLFDMDKSLREGAIGHPDYKVGGWNWRELIAFELFDNDLPLKDYPEADLQRLFYARDIPVEKKHGAGTYAKSFEGIVRKLERIYLGKSDAVLSKDRQAAYEKYFTMSDCTACGGSRLNERARSVHVAGKSIDQLDAMELTELEHLLKGIDIELARPITGKMCETLTHLIDIGVGYLTLNREVGTLSGGESQRVKMARQLQCDLVDLLYVMDEPSVGLHPHDISRLIALLFDLKDRGNSVLVVEHDPDIIRTAEWIIDIGPEAGVNGGTLVYAGPPAGIEASGSVTGAYLAHPPALSRRHREITGHYEIRNARVNNLKNVSVDIPKGVLTCVTGVAGSGKSSLINEVFVKAHPEAIVIDQSPVARSIRSTPATYTGMFDHIRRDLARATGSDPALFSYNSKGACPKCKGNGFIKVEMSFLDDVSIVCDECNGRKYRDEVLALSARGKNIFDILEMSATAALDYFENEQVLKRLRLLEDVGLGYLKIGQPLSTLSGGEAQRIKLASELHKKGALYVLDEPTTGLHMADIARFAKIIQKLVDNRNTVVVIEHNLDIIRQADWIIDMGPEGGSKGGEVLFEGPVRELAGCKRSVTGRYLQDD